MSEIENKKLENKKKENNLKSFKKENENKLEEWCFYLIYNRNYSYAGVTPNPIRRIKKHNQEIAGGAKYTRMVGKGWKYICQVHGFKNKIDALKFEWAVKHCAPKKDTGVYNRIRKLERVLNKERWTSKSPSAIDYKLKVLWLEPGFILEDFEVPNYIEQDINI
jgi:predicted GIY-YIG superfamily endonuclease